MIERVWALLTAVPALVALPFVALVAVFNARWRKGLARRLGFVPRFARADHVLIHAASVGEIHTAAALIGAVVERVGPDRVTISCLTPTGYDEALRRFPNLFVTFFPADAAGIPTRWLRRLGIAKIILVETEIWPHFRLSARRLGIPVAVVNARISDKAFPQFRAFGFAIRRLWRPVLAVAAQSEVFAERLRVLGCPAERVTVTGNLKFEPPSLSGERAPVAEWLDGVVGGRRLLVFASTHAGEEAAALAALASLGSRADVVALFAPRHKERFEEVWRLLTASDAGAVRRSRFVKLDGSHPRLLLLDTHGELAGCFRHACAAFLGGSLTPIGGHNVLEPARDGVPVIVGPHTRNFRPEVELLDSAGALRVVTGSEELAQVLADWLDRPDMAKMAGAAGRDVVEKHRGALAATLDVLARAGFLS